MSIAEQVQQLESDRDRWKERAEAAEEKVADLELRYSNAVMDQVAESKRANAAEKRVKELEQGNKDLQRTIQNNLPHLADRIADLERELAKAKEKYGECCLGRLELIAKYRDLKRQIGNLRQERNSYESRCLEQINEIAELLDKAEERPSSSLEAVLEELREERIKTRIQVDKYGIHASVFCVGGFDHPRKCKSFDEIPAALAKLAVWHYPDSAFARRRKTAEPTPNSSETPQTDDIRDRYRRIRDEVGAYVTQSPGHDYPPMECVYRLVKIINGKEAAK